MYKRNFITMVIILIFSAIIFLIAYFVISYPSKDNYKNLSPVMDYNTFFSINKNVNNYLSYLSGKKIQSIYSLLDEKYIIKNLVTENNVSKKIEIIKDPNLEINADKMYFVSIKNNGLYLVHGRLISSSQMDNSKIIDTDFNIIVLVDYNNYTVSFYPTTSDKVEDDVNRIIEINISPNNVNSYLTAGIISEDDICKYYYNDLYQKMDNDPEGLYNILSSDYAQKFSNYSDFNSFIVTKKEKFSFNIELCDVDYGSNKKRIYTINDDNRNKYILYEDSVMNYQVEMN